VGSLGTWHGRQSLSSRGLDFDELLACFGGNRIAGVAAVRDVKRNGFTDIVQRFGTGVPLADASRPPPHPPPLSPRFFLFQNDRVTHSITLLVDRATALVDAAFKLVARNGACAKRKSGSGCRTL